jgi:hypothetical protein
MAIVQISRIQHRRGRQGGATSIPQLASGEIGWAIDTQELYIGNGAVSEGAPAVGNTKILTEGTNLFALIDQYSYKTNDTLWDGDIPVARSLQSKLDDVVSIFDFGATGDNSDQTTVIQGAIDKLYKTTEVSHKVILWFPAGEYTISSTIILPPFVTLRGAGKGKTIINANNCDLFQTVHYDPNDPGSTVPTEDSQAQYIEISAMTLTSNSKSAVLSLESCKYSMFKDLRFEGAWPAVGVLNDRAEGFWAASKAVVFNAPNSLIICRNNLFSNIEVDSFFYAVYSNTDNKYNTFSDSVFTNLGRGIGFGEGLDVLGGVGSETGPSYNVFERSIFNTIDTQAINVEYGEYNVSRDNQFFNVGNFNSGETVDPAATSIINFVSYTNSSMLDFFGRAVTLSRNEDLAVAYPPEVAGRRFHQGAYVNETTIGNRLDGELLQFPLIDRGTIFVDYVYTDATNSIVKEGTIEIISNTSGIGNVITLNDEFSYIGDNAYADDLTFSAVYNSFGGITTNTITLLATNTIPEADDSFLYKIRVKSN